MSIDLNLSHYTQKNLEDLFGLGQGYTLQEIDEKERILSEKLLKLQVNPTTQQEIIHFLRQAHDKLSSASFSMSTTITRQIISIDTLFRPQYAGTTCSDFIYTLPENIPNVTSVKIVSVEFPSTNYYISESRGNNKFMSGITVLTIPDGYYTIDMLKNNSDITSNFTYNQLMNKFTVNTATVNFNVNNTPLYQQLGWVLGFRKSNYVSGDIGEEPCNVHLDQYFFIDIDDFNNNYLSNAIISTTRTHNTPTYLGKTIMSRIPNYPNYENTIVINSAVDHTISLERTYVGPITLSRLHIRILDKFGQILQLPNDYSFALEITRFIDKTINPIDISRI
jgi:hypothetical protein